MKENFNIRLRAKIIEKALILEKLSGEALKILLKLFYVDTKTLSNKSSSLSFKNKIDLLLDLGNISKDEHKYFLKFMELRNQFAHNYDCNSYEDFKNINPQSSKYISKAFPNEDESFSSSVKNLFNTCKLCLTELINEYNSGQEFEIEKLITNEIFKNIETIIENSFQSWEEWKDDFIDYDFKSKEEENNIAKEGLKRIIVLTIMKKRDQLYQITTNLSLEDIRANLKTTVKQTQLNDYLEMLDNKDEYVNQDIFNKLEITIDPFDESLIETEE